MFLCFFKLLFVVLVVVVVVVVNLRIQRLKNNSCVVGCCLFLIICIKNDSFCFFLLEWYGPRILGFNFEHGTKASLDFRKSQIGLLEFISSIDDLLRSNQVHEIHRLLLKRGIYRMIERLRVVDRGTTSIKRRDGKCTWSRSIVKCRTGVNLINITKLDCY